MEIFGKVTDIQLLREGNTRNGGKYQIQQVEISGSDNVIAEIYGDRDYLTKYNIVVGAEGKFKISSSVRPWKKADGTVVKFMTLSIDNLKTDFMPIETNTAQQQQTEVAPSPEQEQPEKPAPVPANDLPF